MVELMADLAFGRYGLRPMNDRTVARSTPVRCHLLGPLIGCVHRVRPTDRVVVIRLRTAQVVDTSGEKICGLQRVKAVEGNHFVERTLRSSFSRCSVVA